MGISNPATVLGPAYFEGAEAAVIGPELFVNFLGLFLFQIVQLNTHSLVDEDELFAVRRPPRVIAEPRTKLGQYLFITSAVGRANGEFIFPGTIGEVSD